MSGDVELKLAYRQEGLQLLFDVFTETFFSHTEYLNLVTSFFASLPNREWLKKSKNRTSLSDPVFVLKKKKNFSGMREIITAMD